jgi:hypothetical protein
MTPQFSKSAVLFFDVLGTKRMSTGPNASTALPGLVRAWEDVIDLIDQRIGGGSVVGGARRAWFSDSVVVAVPMAAVPGPEVAGGFASLLWLAIHVQATFRAHGLFVRGGFTVDEMYVDGEMYFGPALTRAVELETLAEHPRILVSDEAMRFYLEHRYETLPFLANPSPLRIDGDDRIFLSPLARTAWMLTQGSPPAVEQRPEMLADLVSHRDAVAQKLSEHANESHVEAKYRWLAEYHNEVCRETPNVDPEFLVPLAQSFPVSKRYEV